MVGQVEKEYVNLSSWKRLARDILFRLKRAGLEKSKLTSNIKILGVAHVFSPGPASVCFLYFNVAAKELAGLRG